MTDDREPFREARAAGLKARQERRLENATYTAAEVKVLTEAALRLGREETRAELDALRALWWFIQDDFGVCDNGHGASITWSEANQLDELHDAVEMLYQEGGYPPKPGSGASPDATSGRTDPNSTSAMLKSLEGK